MKQIRVDELFKSWNRKVGLRLNRAFEDKDLIILRHNSKKYEISLAKKAERDWRIGPPDYVLTVEDWCVDSES